MDPHVYDCNSNTPAHDDANKVTQSQHYALSNRLLDKWKAFAREINVFADHDIEAIDMGNQKLEEKINAMFTLWDQKSPTSVTTNDVKRILRIMECNDILLDVFGEDLTTVALLEEGLENITITVTNEHGPIMNEENDLTEFYVHNLRQDHLFKLSAMLDSDDESYGNYSQLEEAIFGVVNTQSSSLSSVNIPAHNFLQAYETKNPKFTVKEFIKLAKSFERNDVAEYLDELDCPETQLRLLLKPQRVNVAKMFNDKNPAIKGWKSFAERLGYNDIQIKKFDVSLRRDQKSPTESLLREISQRRPRFTLTELHEKATEIKREDVALYLKEVIKELTESRF